MNQDIAALLNKAQQSIEGAVALKERDLFGFAASRAYFSMFYIAEAFLITKNLTFSKHSGVISSFGEHFAKTNVVDPRFHRYLIEASEKRHIGDYEILEELSEETADIIIHRAQEFLAAAEKHFSIK